MSAYECIPPKVNELIKYNENGDIALVYSVTTDILNSLQVVLITPHRFLLRGSYSYVRRTLFVDEHSKLSINDIDDIILEKYVNKVRNN